MKRTIRFTPDAARFLELPNFASGSGKDFPVPGKRFPTAPMTRVAVFFKTLFLLAFSSFGRSSEPWHLSCVRQFGQMHSGECNSDAESAKSRWVSFQIGDVYVPEPGQVLAQLHGRDLLQGRIIDFSGSAAGGVEFAVVQVRGLDQPVVVPASKIKFVGA